ncbi:MAG TPA: LPXTG cell wall anchor domain-containing protein [Acidimicrobiia bacterium]
MRNPVRKFVGVALMGVLGALFALPMVAAGAQTVPGEGAPTAPTCTILSTTPNPVTTFPADVTVTGTVQSGVHITLYGQTPPGTGTVVPLASQDVTDDTFSLTANLTGETDLTVNFTYGTDNAYTSGCSTPGGEVVVRVKANEATKSPTAAALAFTGSSDTPSYVLIGIAAIVVGAVLVVAARRRSHLS